MRHTEHEPKGSKRCKKCGNCWSFQADFACVSCDGKYEDHENLYEFEEERIQEKKKIGQDFVPFAENPELQKLVIEEIEKEKVSEFMRITKPKQKALKSKPTQEESKDFPPPPTDFMQRQEHEKETFISSPEKPIVERKKPIPKIRYKKTKVVNNKFAKKPKRDLSGNKFRKPLGVSPRKSKPKFGYKKKELNNGPKKKLRKEAIKEEENDIDSRFERLQKKFDRFKLKSKK
jgi:hypothetical protein